jgi:hypothetical protein
MNPKSDKHGDKASRQPGEPHSSGQQQQAASGAGGQYGEGNYEATRKYNEGLKRHLETSDVEQEARDAAPKSAAEENEMLAAERKAGSRGRNNQEAPEGDAESPDE